MQVRCPRCGSVATVEPGRMPVCPSCGFAGEAPREGPGVPPAQPTDVIERPLPGSVAPGATPKTGGASTGMIVFLIIVGLLLLGAIALAVAYQQGLVTWQP